MSWLDDLRRYLDEPENAEFLKRKEFVIEQLSTYFLVKVLTLSLSLTHREVAKLVNRSPGQVSRIRRRSIELPRAPGAPTRLSAAAAADDGLAQLRSANERPY